jgi:prepilin-type N-terminal cleavage/methylation domain-containing protein
MSKVHKGFTLIELLVVILIISILSVTVFVALNPAKRFADARDARRTADVDSILTAVHEYIVDNGGTAPAGITATEQQLGTAATGCNTTNCTNPPTSAACLDLSTTLAAYLKTMPKDPKVGTAAITGYKISKDANGLVTVAACASEGAVISVSR